MKKEQKKFILGEIPNGTIDKPFILQWTVKCQAKDGCTSVYADTASIGGSLGDIFPAGETVGTTQNNGGNGEIADTTFS